MNRVEAWLAAAVEDAGRRGLNDVRPLLEGLARATAALRAASWNERVSARLEAASPQGRGTDK